MFRLTLQRFFSREKPRLSGQMEKSLNHQNMSTNYLIPIRLYIDKIGFGY